MSNYCGQCGEHTIVGAKFCVKCGAVLNSNVHKGKTYATSDSPVQSRSHQHPKPLNNNPVTKGISGEDPVDELDLAGQHHSGKDRPMRGPLHYIAQCYKSYTMFSGRARRAEYWYFVLFMLIAVILLTVTDIALGTYDEINSIGIFSGIFWLVTIIPYLAVLTRRLHDVGMSGVWIVASIIPFVGLAMVIAIMFDGDDNENKYGPNPKKGRFA